MSSQNVESGRRVALVTADFAGTAGLQGNVVAYIPNRHGAPPVAGDTIHVGGVARTVIAVEKSSYVQRMVLVTLADAAQ